MANIKRVTAKGWLTFDASVFEPALGRREICVRGEDNRRGLLELLGQMALPTFGLKMRFLPGEVDMLNIHGGKTALVQYEIEGYEAVSWGWLENLEILLRMCGVVNSWTAEDVEESGWYGSRYTKGGP